MIPLNTLVIERVIQMRGEIMNISENMIMWTEGGFFSESAMKFFQISKSQKRNIPKNYPELEI